MDGRFMHQRRNRGHGGKFASLPSANYLQRLHRRNEWLIASHHPLRETLISQTGKNAYERNSFLKRITKYAISIAGNQTWAAPQEGEPQF